MLLLLAVLFVLSVGFGLARVLLSAYVNVTYDEIRRPHTLGPDRLAIIIPCYNSEAVIEETLCALPPGYRVYCVASNCTDRTIPIIRSLQTSRPHISLIDLSHPDQSKIKAIIIGLLTAQQAGYSHFLQLDDDVRWPAAVSQSALTVFDPHQAVTAFPVIVPAPINWLQACQALDYMSASLGKRYQVALGQSAMWGSEGVYRCDTFLEAAKRHDGTYIGDDVQWSYHHHALGYRIDFYPRTILTTLCPRTLSAWWKQRAQSWDVGFMFSFTRELLQLVSLPAEQGPHWWIRLLSVYRLAGSLEVFVKVLLPLIVWHVPFVLGIFVACSWLAVAAKYVAYQRCFPTGFPYWDMRLVIAGLTYPAYEYLTWLSQAAAFPIALVRHRHPRSSLTPFIEAVAARFQDEYLAETAYWQWDLAELPTGPSASSALRTPSASKP